MGVDFEHASTPQFQGGYILLRKTLRAVRFVTEWLTYAQDHRIIGDSNEPKIQQNHMDFIQNRHDQTVLSLLAKKWKIDPWPDPSQFGEFDLGAQLRQMERFQLINETFIDLTRDKT